MKPSPKESTPSTEGSESSSEDSKPSSEDVKRVLEEVEDPDSYEAYKRAFDVLRLRVKSSTQRKSWEAADIWKSIW
jgi:hypothetical protein